MGFELSADLAEICGIHAGDGYMRGRGGHYELDISGHVEERPYYDEHIVLLFQRVFEKEIRAKYFPSRNTYGCSICGKKICSFMHSLGFPFGAKSAIVEIPKFIFDSHDPEFYKRFLRGLFDTDGFIHFKRQKGESYSEYRKTHNCYPVLGLSVISKPLFEGVQKLLSALNFNYQAYIFPRRNTNWGADHRILMSGTENLLHWIKDIGFANPSKLSRFLIWSEYGHCPPYTTYAQRKQILDKALDVESLY
ncbi:MAG: hypothetical protein J4203_01595 [Candidatus Diapherotrites archaeon]|uniref:DOD-type homing endonuclease domain-containing protein n=1 Tax=Candidatus Iainarchaeum sp. TaxID=3101447 RepID=A0A8T4L9F6_9ARCH|nr:hypothetical protein [Candidatus Diapherotrites archaeon]